MKLIDGHMHTKYSPKNWFIDCADARGYSAYAVLSLSCMASFGGAANNEQCLEVKRADPTRAYFFAGLVHSCENYLLHVKSWLNRGADGIKLIETKPTVFNETRANLADPVFEPMFAYLEQSGTPVLWHVGDPATFWNRDEAPAFAFEHGWFYGDGGFPTLEELYAIPEAVLERHPHLNIRFAHLYFCGDDRAHAERLLEAYPNVGLDITPGGEMYDWFASDPAGWREFFLRYQNRIQLGTDTDMGDNVLGKTPLALALHGLTETLGLPQDALENITHRNFLAFAGKKPKPLS